MFDAVVRFRGEAQMRFNESNVLNGNLAF